MDTQPIIAPPGFTQEPVVAPEPMKKSFPKWPIFILIFLLGIASVFAYQKFQPTRTLLVGSSPSPSTDPTSTWKTYTNVKYGFLVKYDPNNENNEPFEDQLNLISFGMLKNNGFEIKISTVNNLDYYKNLIIENIDKEEKITVDRIAGIKLTYKQVIVIDKFDISQVIINKNDRDYIITALDSDIDLILSTFKFLDGGSISELLNIKFSGGLCSDGNECSSTKIIMRDGSVLINNKLITKAYLTKLTASINTTDFNEIRSKKFTGTCPTAYDGQEAIYTFYTSTGVQTISSCEFEIDNQSPLFSEINQIFSNLPNEK